MTISTEVRHAGPYAGNGNAVVFPFGFKIFQAADLQVVRSDSDGFEVTLALGTDYTVTLNANQNAAPGGSVTLLAGALATGYQLTLISAVPFLQQVQLHDRGGFFPEVINAALDRLTILTQQLLDRLGRTLRLPTSSTASPVFPVPDPLALIGWNSGGTALTNFPPGDFAAQVAASIVHADWLYDTFAGDGVTTVFSLQRAPGSLGNLDVSVNGTTQQPGTDYNLNGDQVLFVVAPANAASVLIRYGAAVVQGASTAQELIVASDGQTVFTLAAGYAPGQGQVAVYRNGQRLYLTDDYNETGPNTITTTAGMKAGDKLLFVVGETPAGMAGLTGRASIKVAVIGDSTAIAKATTNATWPDIFERTMRHMKGPVEVVNLAIGTGNTTYRAVNIVTHGTKTVVEQCIAENPDIVLVALGVVEGLIGHDGRTLAQAKADASAMFAALRAGLPYTKIIYVSQRPYDSGNFTPATLKNKGVIPGMFTLRAAGILAGAYCAEMLDDAADAGHQTSYTNWLDWDTHVKALGAIDGWLTMDYWRIARMGCCGADGWNLQHYGAILQSAYVIKGLRAQGWFSGYFPRFAVNSAHAGEDPDLLFTATFSANGDGYDWIQSGPPEDIAKELGLARQIYPDAWHLPSKGRLVTSNNFPANEYAHVAWFLRNGPPRTLVETSFNGAAFGTTAQYSDNNGDAFLMSNGAVLGSGTYRFKVGSEIYGPYTITTAGPLLPCVVARRTAIQALPASTNTTVIFDSEDVDTTGAYNNATGVFTAPLTGKYLVAATVDVDAINDGEYIAAGLVVNGTRFVEYPPQYNGRGVSSGAGAAVMAVVPMTAGDALTVLAFSSFACNIAMGTVSNAGTVLTIRWLGY
jgi:hypothetical protein